MRNESMQKSNGEHINCSQGPEVMHMRWWISFGFPTMYVKKGLCIDLGKLIMARFDRCLQSSMFPLSIKLDDPSEKVDPSSPHPPSISLTTFGIVTLSPSYAPRMQMVFLYQVRLGLSCSNSTSMRLFNLNTQNGPMVSTTIHHYPKKMRFYLHCPR